MKQRGQLVLMYALLIPVLFLFVGLTFDLSWYYINASRMQNAADAAVIAGAQKLIDDGESLSEFNTTAFANKTDASKVYESSRGTLKSDKVAKTYVEKNLAKDDALWKDDLILDLWTRKNISFTSTLFGDANYDDSLYYYQVMLEEDVPHMFLRGWFSDMRLRVSSLAKINRYMKGYDFFSQMKYLNDKKMYSNLQELENKKGAQEVAARSIESSDIYLEDSTNKEYNNRVETLEFTNDDSKKIFDSLFMDFNLDVASSVEKFYRVHRVININTVYPVRNYNFYINNNPLLSSLQSGDSDYKDFTNEELAVMLSKGTSDPLYIRIESEPLYDSVRQIIINVNVSNMDERTDRPIVFFYDGPEYNESLPIILNLNAGFRGVLYAPNSPVVINGNGNNFRGFVIASSYVQLVTTEDKELTHEIKNEYGNKLIIDYYGDVQYKKNPNETYQTVDVENFTPSAYNLASAEFDSLHLVNFDTTTISGNLFTTETAANLK